MPQPLSVFGCVVKAKCVKFDFAKSYLPSDSHTNTVISDRFAHPSRLRRKP